MSGDETRSEEDELERRQNGSTAASQKLRYACAYVCATAHHSERLLKRASNRKNGYVDGKSHNETPERMGAWICPRHICPQ